MSRIYWLSAGIKYVKEERENGEKHEGSLFRCTVHAERGIIRKKKKQAHSQETQANQPYHKGEGDKEETDQREPK
jgi:hypothetical protein